MEKVRPITNPQNNFVRFIKSLKKKKKRLEEGKFLLEGINSVEEALKSGIEIPYFIYSLDLFRVKGGQELFDTLEKNGSRLILVAEKIFNKLADTQNPQGILAVPSRIDWDASELYSLECSFVLVLDGIQDPGNMGTIVRLADAIACNGIIVSSDSVDHYNPKTVRSTMGAIFRVPVFKPDNFGKTMLELKENGYTIMGTLLSPHTQSYETVNYTEHRKIALVIGNESRGLSDNICKLTDIDIKIPILGEIESLNAGVATGIVAYEIMRQKNWRL